MKRAFMRAMGMGRGGGQCNRCGARHRRGSTRCLYCDALDLNDIPPGATCTICRLTGCGPVRQRLLDLGFQPGRSVTVVRNAPLRDPIELQLDDSFIVLRRREAAHIEVRHG